jgi:MarR family transcriptional regulator, organic hydroperoxide resistance regulator
MADLLALFTQAAKLMREATDEAMSRHGVRVGQHIVLSVLWAEDGLPPGEIARRLEVATPTIVNTATRMEEAGLLVRRPDPYDARLVRLYLTPYARSVRESVKQARAGLERRATATLDPAELDHLRSALEKIIAQLREGRTDDLPGLGGRRLSGVGVPGPGLGAGLDRVPGAA